MALIPEDGTGVETANSYVEVSYADTYHATYGNTSWAAKATEKKELALINASLAADLMYGARYLSVPVSTDQAFLFPRLGFSINGNQYVSSDEIPKHLKNAVAELALIYVGGEQSIYPETNTDGSIKRDTVKIGPLEFTTEFNGSPDATEYPGMNKVEMLLAPILCGKGLANNSNILGL